MNFSSHSCQCSSHHNPESSHWRVSAAGVHKHNRPWYAHHPCSFPRASPKVTPKSKSHPFLPLLPDPQIQPLSKSYRLYLHNTPECNHCLPPPPLSPSSSHHPLSRPNWCPSLPQESQNHLLKMGVRSYHFPAPRCVADHHLKNIGSILIPETGDTSLTLFLPAAKLFPTSQPRPCCSLLQEHTSGTCVVCPSPHSGLCSLSELSSPHTPCSTFPPAVHQQHRGLHSSLCVHCRPP